MSLDRSILKTKVKLSGVPTEGLKIIYDWYLPDPVEGLSEAQTQQLAAGFDMVFNVVHGANRHCKNLNINYASTEVNPAFSIGQNHSVAALCVGTPCVGGQFLGNEALYISGSEQFKNYTMFIDFDFQCHSQKSKSMILLTNRNSVDDAGGFMIGINGSNSIFYEFFDINGIKHIKTFFKPLGEKCLISISKSADLGILSINVYDSVSKKAFSESFEISENESLSPWIIGDTRNNFSALHEEYTTFVGNIKSFVLIDGYLSKFRISSIFESFLLTSYTAEHYEDIDTAFKKPGRHIKVQVEDGVKISGYTYMDSTLVRQDGSNVTITKKVPTYEANYKDSMQFVNSNETVTKGVSTLIPESKTFDDQKVREYGQKSIFLKNDTDISKVFELYSRDLINENIEKRATFNPSGSKFVLDRSYGSSENINIYFNGLLMEPNADYQVNDGKDIVKIGGSFINTDSLYYDVIPGDALFFDFFGYSQNIYLGVSGESDVYLDGKKLLYGATADYKDFSSSVVVIFAAHLSAGRMAVIPRNPSVTQKLISVDKYSHSLSFNPIGEQVWLGGKRLVKDLEYFLKNMCDLNVSENKAEEKTTLIYNNEGTFFNI